MNIIQSIFAVVLPMFTFPYLSRTLGVYNLGKINYVNSIISYFLLIANLGVASYAGREVALVRDNKEKAGRVASEIFSLNIISTIISYICLIASVMCIDKLVTYRGLLLFSSITIITNVSSASWIFTVYEEYSYMAVKSMVAQLVTAVCLFVFIKKADHYFLYVVILQLIAVGTCICDLIYRKKLINVHPIYNKAIFAHFKPIMLMFGVSIAGSIYVNSDTTLLGYMCSDYEVGIYSAAVKIYNMIKTFLNALITVMTPRLMAYLGNKKEKEFTALLEKGINLLLIFALPMLVGVELLSKDVIEVFCGKEYEAAVVTLRILSPSFVISTMAYLLMSGVMIPNRKDKEVMKISIISAIINIVANVVLIPLFKQNAAAMTTVISEIYMLVSIMFFCYKNIKCCAIKKSLIQSVVASMCMGGIVFYYHHLVANIWIKMIGSTMIGCIIYFVILLLMKNPIVSEMVRQIRQVMHKKCFHVVKKK